MKKISFALTPNSRNFVSLRGRQNMVRADLFSGSLAVCASHSEATISSFSLAEYKFERAKNAQNCSFKRKSAQTEVQALAPNEYGDASARGRNEPEPPHGNNLVVDDAEQRSCDRADDGAAEEVTDRGTDRCVDETDRPALRVNVNEDSSDELRDRVPRAAHGVDCDRHCMCDCWRSTHREPFQSTEGRQCHTDRIAVQNETPPTLDGVAKPPFAVCCVICASRTHARHQHQPAKESAKHRNGQHHVESADSNRHRSIAGVRG